MIGTNQATVLSNQICSDHVHGWQMAGVSRKKIPKKKFQKKKRLTKHTI